MSAPSQSFPRRAIVWLIRQNPTYLASACLVALGAHGLLADQTDPAGDVVLIVVTLAAVQVYEWAVGAILVSLHRARRSPEDAPMLLFVGAIFWTGPIAATLEMIALRPTIGTAVAAGASIVAIGEMIAVARLLGLRLRFATYAVATGCVALLAVAAPLLKMPIAASGINEILLYAAWWIFAALIFACRGIARSFCKLKLEAPTVAVQSPTRDEFVFLVVTVIATAVQLYGMNYGYFCHARAFYAAPALISASAVAVSLLHPFMKHFMTRLTLATALPFAAIALASQPFDATVPVELLPTPLRHPLVPTLIIAAAAWFYAFSCHRFISHFHAANAALALAAYRTLDGLDLALLATARQQYLAVLVAAVIYLAVVAIVLRSRSEALAALGVGFVAVFYGVWNHAPADDLIVIIALGWTAFFAFHIAAARPRLLHRLLPIAMLTINPWLCDSARDYQELIAAHSACLIAFLIILGHIRPWTSYRSIGLLLASIHAAVLSTQWIAATPSPTATVLTLAGFALLFAGAAVSWHKDQLLASMPTPNAPVDTPVDSNEGNVPTA